MKKLWLLLLMVTPLQLTHAQQVHHAPTVAQCRANQQLWLSKLQTKGYVSLSVHYLELDYWLLEMENCLKVDHNFEARYRYTENEIFVEEGSRLRNFLKRHNLVDQFMAEDAQGMR
jgi:hypothetical protein